ncbi:MAG TPA: pyrroline-5-carboxylate reductase [Candidatus Omnitrophota bacterium]|nr:pyrroline-5-carboxylate reductase [Candidatus Omnitrophota bacterium]
MNIGMIGGGNMGGALINGLWKKNTIFVCEQDRAKMKRLSARYKAVSSTVEEIAKKCPVIILAVKPQDMDAVLDGLKAVIRSKHLVISIAAGITSQYFEKRLGAKTRVVRAMPNMPAQIGEGVTALSKGKFATAADLKKAATLLKAVGKTVVVKEGEMDAVTAVSGSGPAYVFLFAECMIKAARSLGLKDSVARELVYETLLGSARQLKALDDDPARLRARVTSKGGTTQAALEVLTGAKIEQVFQRALKAAKDRSQALAKK